MNTILLLVERLPSLTPIGRTAVKDFMDDFSSYLEVSNWRTFWGQYAADRSGPRTNNAVEKANRMIKEEVTDNRRRRTLIEFAAYLNNSAAWAKISQYGHTTNKGEIQKNHRRGGASFLATKRLCEIPRNWDTAPGIFSNQRTGWIFLRGLKASRCSVSLSSHIEGPDEIGECARRFCESNFSTLDEARQLTSTFCIVSYSKSSGILGSFCSCSTWRKSLVCEHMAAVAHLSGADQSPEAIEQWKYMLVYFRRAKQNRSKSGRFDENVLPSDARYGIGRGRSTSSRRPQKRDRSTGASPDGEASPVAKRQKIIIKGARR